MAAVHNTSIIFEVRNAIWHIFEQGIGGILMAMIFSKINKSRKSVTYEKI